MRAALLFLTVFVVLMSGCAGDNPLAVPAAAGDPSVLVKGVDAVVDISGTWAYSERTFLVLKPEGDVIHINCVSPDGVLTIEQDGSNFTGSLVHTTTRCETKDGEIVPAPWALPYEAVLSGRITGRAFHFDQIDAPPAPPVNCPKQGTVKVSGGQVVELSNTGRCDLSFLPFPAVATNSATATRQ